MAAAIGLLLALIVAPSIAGRIIRWRLQAMIAAQLNAELRVGDLSYHFPYGVEVTDAALVAPGPEGKPIELLRLPRLALKLARFPLRRGPLVIERIVIDRPAVHLIRDRAGWVGARGLAKTEAEKQEQTRPWKVSDMFRLQEFDLNGGEIVYEDRSLAGTRPLVWKNLDVHLNTARESDAGYAFHFVADHQPIASLDAAGSADLDSLVLKLDRCTLGVNVDPSQESSAIPPEYQRLLNDLGIRGGLTLSALATFPLRDLPHSSYDTTLRVTDAKAHLNRWKTNLNRFSASLHLSDGNGRPSIEFTSLDAATDEGSVQLSGGAIEFDPRSIAWTLRGLAGRIESTGKSPGRERGSVDFSLAKLGVEFGRPPDGAGPLVVDRVVLADPRLHVVRLATAPAGPASADRAANPPAKMPPAEAGPAGSPAHVTRSLSDLVRLGKLDLTGGEIVYEDRTRPDALPLAWNHVKLQLGALAKSRSGYAFQFGTDSAPSASIDATGAVDLDSMLFTLDQCNLTAAGVDRTQRTSPFPADLQQTMERLAIGGSLAASVHASLPLRDPLHGTAEVRLLPTSFAIHPPGMAGPIDQFAEAELTLKDGALSARHLRAAFGNDLWYLKQADVDLSGLPKQLRVIDADGAITFRAPRATYPKLVENILAPLDPAGPFFFNATALIGLAPGIKTDYVVHGHTTRGRLNLVDGKLPVYNINSEFTVTPAAVDIPHLEAGAARGELKVSGTLHLPGTTRYDLKGTLRGADLNDLMHSLTPPGQKQAPLGGRGNLAIHVAGIIPDNDRPAIDFLTGSGDLEVKDGDFWRIPIMKGIADSSNVRSVMTVGEAAAVFTISDKTVHLSHAAVSAPALGVEGHGDVAFDGKLNVDCISTVLGKWGEKFDVGDDGTVSRTVDQIQQALNGVTQAAVMNIHVSGSPNHPAIDALPVPFIARPTVNFVKFLQGQGSGASQKQQQQTGQQSGGLLGYVKDQPAPSQQQQQAPAK